MKSFFQFLSEASASTAVQQAARMGLKSDGHGGWYDKNGEFVAKTEKGQLKFYNKRQRVGQQDPPQTGKEKNLSATTQEPAQQEPAPQQQSQAQELPAQEGPPPVEKTKGTLTIAFGRFNPPTTGHEKLLDTVASSSDDNDYIIVPSRSQDKKKNPLDPDTKVSVMRQMFPKHSEKIVNDAANRTIFDVLKKAHMDGYTNVRIIGGGDRVAEFEKLSNNYNGKLYAFDNVEVRSAGERDPDSEDDVSGMSASKQRKAAAEGDFKTFRKGVPASMNDKQARELYNTLRSAMNIKEGWNLWEIAPKFDWKNLRENYIKKRIFNIGELVENLNTGLVGKIIRRGTNYLICVTEDNIMFKSWIRDVVETKNQQEVPMKNLKSLVKASVNRTDTNIDGFVDVDDKKVGPYGAFIPTAKNQGKVFRSLQKEQKLTDVSGVPANQREVGTDAFREYAMKMTNTSYIKNFINRYRKKSK
jgi:nicotinamide mononucleotide adenylyltransferase